MYIIESLLIFKIKREKEREREREKEIERERETERERIRLNAEVSKNTKYSNCKGGQTSFLLCRMVMLKVLQ